MKVFDTVEKTKEQKVADYLAEIEIHGGPIMPLKRLEEFVLQAPDDVRRIDDFCYLIGLLFSRYMYEVVGNFDPNSQIGPYMPFKDLEAFIMGSGEPDKPETTGEPRQKKLLRGFYDGRLIHEELGGINNEDNEI